MNVARATTTMRARSRLSADSIRATANQGFVEMNRVSWPDAVEPGSRNSVTVEIRADANNLLGTFVGDPDFCQTGPAGLNDGIKVDLRAHTGGRQGTATRLCVPDGGTKTHSTTFTAPESGSFTLRVEAEGGNSNNFLGAVEKTIDVATGGDDGADLDDDGNGAECAGLVDALTKPGCSFDNYVANAQSGATLALGAGALLFVALAAN